MGIFCEINLQKPADGCFRSGSTVSGTIKYTLTEDMIFKRITISLKGNGRLAMQRRAHSIHRHHRHQHLPPNHTFINTEEYVDIDNIIYNNEKKAPLSRGSYETQFSFTLPSNIPSSLKCLKITQRFTIRCLIMYYIRIKFEKPGFLQFDTKFKNNIKVLSGIAPKLSTVPTIHGEQKKLTILSQLFSSKKSIVDIKANVQSCILQPGGKIEINYEILNNTNVEIKGVETKLIEIYGFIGSGGREDLEEDVPYTDTKTGSIKCTDTQKMDISINVPVDRHSLENSKMVSRQYVVVIQAMLPLPHRDAVLKIPVQIDGAGMIIVCTNDPPPCYWEAMGEETKENSGDDNDINEGGDSEHEKKS